MVQEQLKAFQGEMERLAAQQGALTVSVSNQASVLGRKLEQGLQSAMELSARGKWDEWNPLKPTSISRQKHSRCIDLFTDITRILPPST